MPSNKTKPKMNVMDRLEFELVYYNFDVQHVSYNTTVTPPKFGLFVNV